MRTTIDIDERLLDLAMKLTEASTKREVVNFALKELVRRRRLERLKQLAGSGCVTLTLKELKRLRRMS